MPKFSSYSLFQKLYLGVSSGLYTLTFTDCLPFTLCLTSLVFAKFRKFSYVLLTLVVEYFILKVIVKFIIKHSGLKFDGTFVSIFPVTAFTILLVLVLTLFALTYILKINLKQKVEISFFIL